MNKELEALILDPFSSAVVGYTSSRRVDSPRHYFIQITKKNRMSSEKYFIGASEVEYFSKLVEGAKKERASKTAALKAARKAKEEARLEKLEKGIGFTDPAEDIEDEDIEDDDIGEGEEVEGDSE